MHMLRTRPLMAVIAAVLALLVLTGIAYAVGRLTGFIPGIGFVEDVHSYLETPIVVERAIVLTPTAGEKDMTATQQVTTPVGSSMGDAGQNPLSVQERNGITLTVEQAVSEADRLVISYKVSGLPPNLFGPERIPALQAYSEAHPDEPMPQQVRLPDGTYLEHASGGHCGGGGDLTASWLSCRSIYAPLPEGVNQFTLEIHRLQNALPDELPENWSIPIQLTPVSISTAAGSLQEPNLTSGPVNGVTLRLNKVDQSPAQTAFQFAMEWTAANRFVRNTAPITLQDTLGRYYILSGGPDSGTYTNDNPNYSTLPSLVTSPVDGSGPLTFRVDWVVLSISTRGSGTDGGAAKLKFDPGISPGVGQEWTLDQTFQAGEFVLQFSKARLKAAQDGGYTLEFDIQAPPGITGIILYPKDSVSSSTESGYDRSRGVLVTRVTLASLPTQPVELYVAEVLYKVDGPWEITWQPRQLSGEFPTPTQAPTRMAPTPVAFATEDPLLAELRSIDQRAYSQELFDPGWVHQVMEMDQAESVGVLDTGDLPEQPLHTRVDAWYRLDENGFVRTKIYIRKTLDGQFVSAAVDNGVYHFYLPEGRGGGGQDIYMEKPAYGLELVSTLSGYLAEGGTIRKESGTLGGNSCRLYEATRNYDPPQVFYGEPAPVRAMHFTACMDPANGRTLLVQNRMDYTDGTSRISSSTRFLTLEKVTTLPDEARKLLDSIVMP